MIITSLLDTDLYKFTMMQAVLHRFPGAMVEYRFKCRNPGVDLRPYAAEIRAAIKQLCQLRLQSEELDYLRQFAFFKSDFIDFLHIFQLNNDFINVVAEDEFDVIIRGPWLHTIMFEVPVLAIIGEIYARQQYPNENYEKGRKLLAEKINFINTTVQSDEFKFADYGTRRRFSKAWHTEVVSMLQQNLPQHLAGTSNVALAKQFNLRPLGTMAHEYIQACQALGPRLIYSQQFAFENWAQEYRGALGIALSDTYGLNAFLHDFDLYFCKLFDGARQDSGDPIHWGEKLLQHYQQHRVDPRSKTLVFSDQLNFHRAVEIFQHFQGRANLSFGIGTFVTNDIGHPALQNVIKMVECNGQPVAKVSDAPDKTMCRDASYLAYLKRVFHME